MTDVIAAILMLLGSAFALISAVGLLRLPDLLIRMHAATKAGTLGAGFVLLAVAVDFGGTGIAVRAIATIIFLFATAPVAAHLIGRASYFVGVRLWDETIVDELRGRYNPETHELDPDLYDPVVFRNVRRTSSEEKSS
ncbi:MAG: monovalent cation/H(+) antiporter subunit G [Trueperaceae bacterium]|nr:monovalent cation/H(+) antiporter subunit G [Trueperaceae bacterium]